MTFKSFNLSDPSYSNSLSESIVSWIDYGFYSASGFTHTSGNLSLVSHPVEDYAYGSNRKNWVWEHNDISVRVSGVIVSGYTVNYRDGLIYFDSQPSGQVFAEYSYKNVYVFDARNNKFLRGGSSNFDVYQGSYREDSIQLPAIGVELGGLRSFPFELGSYSRDIKQTVLLNIFHSNSNLVERISDILNKQVDSHVDIFDYYQAYDQSGVSLEHDGTLLNRSGTHPYLSNTYPFPGLYNSVVYIEDTEIEHATRLDNKLYHGTVRLELDSTLSMID